MNGDLQFSPQALTEPPKGYLERNWKWLLAVMLLGVVLLFAVSIGGIFALVFGSMKSSDAYKVAVAKAKENPAVIAALGQPIEEGWLVSGNISVNGPSGKAELSIPIEGPKKKASIYLNATKSAGQWKFSLLQVEVDGVAERIDLLAEENPGKK